MMVAVFVLANLAVDLLNAALDPSLRRHEEPPYDAVRDLPLAGKTGATHYCAAGGNRHEQRLVGCPMTRRPSISNINICSLRATPTGSAPIISGGIFLALPRRHRVSLVQ